MAAVLSRSSRICRRGCISLCLSSLHLWRPSTANRITNPSFKSLSSISKLSNNQSLVARVDVIGILAINHRHFCSNPSNADPAVSSAAVKSEAKVPKSSADSDSRKDDKSDQSKKSGSDKKSPVSWLSLLFTLATGGVLIYVYGKLKDRRIEAINKSSATVIEGPSAGKAAIGGPFSLINHDGKRVTDEDFHGMWNLIYFGFTHCPDICPDELQKLAAAVDMIKERAGIDIVPIFISVDPERDTVEQVREYVKEFHPKLIGLTGDANEVRKVARAYRVYYMKAAEEEDDYLVDHSIAMYLMAPDNEFVKFFGKNNTVDEIADGIIKEMKQYKKVG